MPNFDFQTYKIDPHEKPANSAKMSNFIQAAEDAVNDLPISSLHGYPSDATMYPDGSGNWSVPSAAGAPVGGWTEVSSTWTFSSADDKTFVMNAPAGADDTYTPGNRIRLKQLGETTFRYFIITAVSDTKVTVWGGTDYSVDNSTISDIGYSTDRFPVGFPTDPAKWTLELTDTTEKSYTISDGLTRNVWANVGEFSIDVPIGSWQLSWGATMETDNGAQHQRIWGTLSTGDASETDTSLTQNLYADINGSNGGTFGGTMGAEKNLKLAAKTTYYLNAKTSENSTQEIRIAGDLTQTFIRAFSAYL